MPERRGWDSCSPGLHCAEVAVQFSGAERHLEEADRVASAKRNSVACDGTPLCVTVIYGDSNAKTFLVVQFIVFSSLQFTFCNISSDLFLFDAR